MLGVCGVGWRCGVLGVCGVGWRCGVLGVCEGVEVWSVGCV